jgi:teichuronic acid biosynthesis glycosyltransferase TuaG
MTDNISFTVVIPVFNGETTIASAIESCLQQTVLPDEIIIVDDGSTDRTASVVAMFNNELIRYQHNEQNSGPSHARNQGIRSARSSWILFLDADDVFHYRKLELTLLCLQHNKTIRAVGHAFRISKGNGYPNGQSIPSEIPLVKRLSVFNTLLRNPAVTPSLAVSAANDIFFDEDLFYAEDHDFYAEDHDFIIRTAEKYGFWYMDVPLCSLGRLPLTAGGISSHRWEMRKGEIRMYIAYCRRNRYYLLIPLFVIFSLLKHLKNLLSSPAGAGV